MGIVESILLGFLLIVSLLAAGLLILHFSFKPPRIREKTTPDNYGMPFEVCSVPSVNGKQLYTWLILNDPSNPTVIVLHGWGGNAAAMLPLAQPFFQHGFNIILFDARNHGRSDGGGHSSMPRFAEDLESVIDWSRQRVEGKLVLLGHSVGAAAVLLAASRRNDVDAVISIASFAHPEWLMQRYFQRFHLPERLIQLLLRYIEWIIGHRFEDIAPVNTLCRLRCPALLVHGTADRTVPVSDARLLKQHCDHENVQLMLVDGADHDSVEMIEAHQDGMLNFLRGYGIKGSVR